VEDISSSDIDRRGNGSVKKIKVVITDDSLVARKFLEKFVTSDDELELVQTFSRATHLLEWLENNSQMVDVILLDIAMPEMSGLEALEIIKKKWPKIQVIVVSSLSDRDTIFEAMEKGAFDFVVKERQTIELTRLKDDIIEKIKASVGRSKGLDTAQIKESLKVGLIKDVVKKVALSPTSLRKYFIIGASTGGPATIEEILKNLKYFPDVAGFIIQHMFPGFTSTFANRLTEQLRALNPNKHWIVKEAEDGEMVKGGVIYVAPGGKNMIFRKEGLDIYIVIEDPKPEHTYVPNVNYAFEKIIEVVRPSQLVAVLLTGMGDDGAVGLKIIKEAGGWTIVESRESAVVWGMPRVAYEIGAYCEVLPKWKIAEAMNAKLL